MILVGFQGWACGLAKKEIHLRDSKYGVPFGAPWDLDTVGLFGILPGKGSLPVGLAPHGEAGLRFSGNRGLFMLGVSQTGRNSFHLVELLRKFAKSGVKIRAREHRFGLAANPGQSGTYDPGVVGSWVMVSANLERLVLGCNEAKFCK